MFLYHECNFNHFLNRRWYAYSFMTVQDGHPCDTYAKGWFAVIDKEYSSSSSYPSTCLHMKQQQYPIFAYAEYNHKTKWFEKSKKLEQIVPFLNVHEH